MNILMRVILMILLGAISSNAEEKAIHLEINVNGSLEEVWNAWTTKEGINSFFAPECNVELIVGGAYEMYFDLTAEKGSRGGEGNKILAIQTQKMLSFSWNAPPSLPDVRNQRTHVTLRFLKIKDKQTKVILYHDGWGEGGQWDKAFEYFTRAWGEIVLPYLQYRFEKGPINWQDPPKIK